MNDKSDFDLIQLYIKGDNRAFEVLYARYRNQLYCFINRMLNFNRSEADDIFQTVWIKAIDKMASLRDNGSFYGYLQQIARNIVIDRARKLKRHGVHIAIDDDESIPIADVNAVEPYFDILDNEEQEILKKAVETLSSEQKNVWELRMKNFSFKDIAEIEKCSINTVLARMSYAKKNIKLYIETHF